jgi:hypothetical protein
MEEMIVVRLVLPPRALSPNARVHWGQRARAVERYRIHAMRQTILAAGYKRGWARATAQAYFFWKTNRRRDIANAEAMLKPAYDGIVDAGLIPDDRAGVLAHAPTRFDTDCSDPRVEIRLWRACETGN